MFDYNLKKKMSSLLKVTAVSTVLMAGTQMSFKHTMAESQAKRRTPHHPLHQTKR